MSTIPEPARRLGSLSGGALVVSSMIGTGIYTTSGLMIRDLGSPLLVLLAWALGGLLAALAAVAYGKLATALPENGGEYQLLGHLYHPAVGFMAGWVSLVAGFAAPVAVSAAAFSAYAGRMLPGVPEAVLALTMIGAVTVAHLRSVGFGSKLQVLVTTLQVALMLGFVAVGLLAGDPGDSLREHLASSSGPGPALPSRAFAHALIYVSFAYSGYNAAIYVAGEMRCPERTLPRALVGATLLVVVLYVLMNLVYLRSGPAAELAGEVEIGFVVARRLLGPAAASVISILICVCLVGCVSALTFTGPRVCEAMSRDAPLLGYFAVRSRRDVPRRATILQSTLAGVIVLTASFDAILTYVGLLLSFATLLALLGVFRLRRLGSPHAPGWGVRVAAAMAAALVIWIIVGTAWDAPPSALVAVMTLCGGGLIHWTTGCRRTASKPVDEALRATSRASVPRGS